MRVLPPQAFEGKQEEMTTAHLYLSRWAKKYLRPNKSAIHDNFSDILGRCETPEEVEQLLMECAKIKGPSQGTRRKWRRWAIAKIQSLRAASIIASTVE